MKTLGILSALFASLNNVEDLCDIAKLKQNRVSKMAPAPSKTKRTKGTYDRSQRIRANRRKSKRCLTK